MFRSIFASLALILSTPALAMGSAPSTASVAAWGPVVQFNYAAAKRDGIIAGKTEVRRMVKNSPTISKTSVIDGRWDSIANFTSPLVVGVQFKAGDPAYTALRDWIN